MNPTEALLREVAAMKAVQDEIMAVTARTDNERKRELVRLRRQLAEQVARVSVEGEKVFGASADTGVAAAFRARLSTMRSAIALHQANWPAVSLDDANEEFIRSGAAARASKEAFLSWTREALAPADVGRAVAESAAPRAVSPLRPDR